jgi:hypothetical protein
MIDVHLYGKLRALAPSQALNADFGLHVPVNNGDTIANVLTRLGIAPDAVAHLFLNHEYSGPHRRVRDGDRLGVFGRDMALLYRQYFPKVEE